MDEVFTFYYAWGRSSSKVLPGNFWLHHAEEANSSSIRTSSRYRAEQNTEEVDLHEVD